MIINPFAPKDPKEVARLKKLRDLYNTNESVRKLADQIHNHRMLPPPACDDCIEMALRQLNLPPVV